MKETDLTHVHPGEPVDITIDTYPGCKWDGHVDSVSAGSDTSLLGAAGGECQRQLGQGGAAHPGAHRHRPERSATGRLRAGMSAVISIDTGKRRWYRLLDGM